MKHHKKEHLNTRRDFLRQSACATLGVTGLVNALAQTRLMAAALSQNPANGYKALVCLFMQGGNDSNNMVVPMGTDDMRTDYEAGRGVLALDKTALKPITISDNAAFQKHYSSVATPSLGFHPNAEKLATLFNSGDLSIVSNVGTLAYPMADRNDYINGTVPRPIQLFSHSDQTTQWQSSVSDSAFQTGWGGRVADLLHASYGNNGNVSMSISLSGINSFQVGTAGGVTQYIVNPSGAIPLSGYNSGSTANGNYLPYGNAYTNGTDVSGGYKTTNQGKKLQAFERIMGLAHDNLLEDQYAKIVRSARENEQYIGAATNFAATLEMDDPDNAGTTISVFDYHFKNAQSKLGDQLKMIAKLIAGKNHLCNDRQIFFCEISGFDTHQNMLSDHANLMTELSEAMFAFNACLNDIQIDISDDVTTFTASDFNRTMTPNGDMASSAGSDHAWGGHALVMGGSVNGGKVYGHYPSLKTGDAAGSIDSHSKRGRWIPDISVDQYSAVLAKWAGVDSNSLDAIFPNLNRFDDPFTATSANLNFL